MNSPASLSRLHINHLAVRFVQLCWIIVLKILLTQSTAYARDADWRQCDAPFVPQMYRPIYTQMESQKEQTSGAEPYTYMSADYAEVIKQNDFQFRGNVQIRQGPLLLNADQVDYQHSDEKLQAEGAIRFETNNLLVVGEKANFDLSQQSGTVNDSRIWMEQAHLRGEAKSLDLLGEDRVNMHSAAVTSCNEGDNDWKLKASELRLDRSRNEGIARHARLELYGVPVLYSPYLSFPIEGRKSGFLAPDIGTSNVSGFEFSLPYYWNIAPNYDATFTPRYYDKRGLQLDNEFRYLTRYNTGRAFVAYLPNDRVFGDDRLGVMFEHRGNPISGVSTAAQYLYISDTNYLDDFGGTLGVSSLTHLERYIDVNYRSENWSTKLFFQDYQTIDPAIPKTSYPYSRRPEVRFDTPMLNAPYKFQYQFNSEFVNFYKEEGLVGNRLDLLPAVQWAQRKIYGFFVPKGSLRYTAYQLENNDPSTSSSPSRTIPTFSLDSGLFFERDWELQSGNNMVQTLEPRIFYLYVPYEDQSDLLVDENGRQRVFDSGTTLTSFSQIFRENRFTGADLIGDANQVTLALTSRFLDFQGREKMAASLGQIVYFDDRRVTFPGGQVQTDPRSDLVFEWRSQWTRSTRTLMNLLWDDIESSTDKGTFQFRYKPDQDKMLNLAYRYEIEAIEQAEATLILPLFRRWKLVGHWQYSLRDKRTQENFEGIEYQSCCWALRFVHRRFLIETEQSEYNNNFLIQLELKGLANVGSDINRVFTEGVYD